MNDQTHSHQHVLSRRSMLRHTAVAGAIVVGVGSAPAARAATMRIGAGVSGADLKPLDAIQTILDATGRYPLVGLGERHMMQEMHDFIAALLFHPDLPGKIDDIAVEFGNAAYQDLADRFILGDKPVARADLAQIWRQIGDPGWNAPIYEQFFRNVRAVNWMQPPSRRIRVLLGQPPVTMSQVIAHPTDRALIGTFNTPMDDHYAAVIEREVLAKGRRALLIAGDGHLVKGMVNDGTPPRPNAATQIVRRHPGSLFTVDLFLLPHVPAPPPGMANNPNVKKKLGAVEAQARQVAARFADWPRPAVAYLAGTWLGAQQSDLSYRAITPAAKPYAAQADAILYLGPNEVLTASQPDPAIYHWGAYPGQLQRASQIAQAGDQLAYGIQWATSAPTWWSLFSNS
jgi:hypothetical protein